MEGKTDLAKLTTIITNEGERYLPLVQFYNAAMHLGHMASYREALRYSYGRRVLDLGCGVGYGSFWLASYATRHIIAVDLSHAALQYAQHRYASSGLCYLQADALHLPFADASFDFVFSSQVIEHVASAEQFMREVKRLLTPDGFCLFTTPNKTIFSPYSCTNPHHPSEMTWDTYQQIAHRVFPRTWFRGIPQRCLTLSQPNHIPLVKSNAEIRPEDYRVQDERLEECENMLCFGHNRVEGEFTPTLPIHLQPVADELGPIFWDADTSRWMVLGVYPGDQNGESIELSSGQRLAQTFRSPYACLYHIEVDLAIPTSLPIHVALHQGTQLIVEKVVTPYDHTIALDMAPHFNSQEQIFVLTLELAPYPKPWWSRHRDLIHLSAAHGQPLQTECRLDNQLIHQQIAMRTFHAPLPQPERL
ncbi:MAG TPA: class I SAM-dependent methyltransferase [Anaerolineae bacterium]|nr:class I SAM-dependent methyltransferase [Anaerolineae bacterium]HQH38155.1 class I SAM-dependent methyltransferase [Anaerolineae bacterium]